MGLAQTQALLARLLTDAALRERFLLDPLAVGREWGLTPGEAGELAAVSQRQLNDAARALLFKRLREVEKLLPLARRALGGDFGDLFLRYAETGAPVGAKRHRADAVAFARHLDALSRAGRDVPAWAAEITRCEAAGLEMGDPARRWRGAWFRYDLERLSRDLMAGKPPAPRIRPMLAVWLRPSRGGRVRLICLRLPRFPHREPGSRL